MGLWSPALDCILESSTFACRWVQNLLAFPICGWVGGWVAAPPSPTCIVYTRCLPRVEPDSHVGCRSGPYDLMIKIKLKDLYLTLDTLPPAPHGDQITRGSITLEPVLLKGARKTLLPGSSSSLVRSPRKVVLSASERHSSTCLFKIQSLHIWGLCGGYVTFT